MRFKYENITVYLLYMIYINIRYLEVERVKFLSPCIAESIPTICKYLLSLVL